MRWREILSTSYPPTKYILQIHLLNELHYLLKIRKENNLKTKFYHIYSHLLDCKTKESLTKMEKMKTKFPTNFQQILKLNQDVDLLSHIYKHLSIKQIEDITFYESHNY